MKRREYRQGAAVVTAAERIHRRQQERRAQINSYKQHKVVNSEAHRLALAKSGKSWAKRWLRAHREHLYRNGL